MTITHRALKTEQDWWRVRNLLIQTYDFTPFGFNWDIRHWDGWRYHWTDPAEYDRNKQHIHQWETSDGTLVGVAHPEYRGDVWLEVNPEYRLLEREMIEWAEANLAVPASDGNRFLQTYIQEYDLQRRDMLIGRGYTRCDGCGVMRRLRFNNTVVPNVKLANGYQIRTTCPDPDDYQRIATLLNAAFKRMIHTAQEVRAFMAQAPAFRHDLDLVVEAPDGSFASYVGVYFDEDNHHGIFKPVCTHPDHQQKGLAKALMFEGIRRLQTMGAADVSVDTGDMVPANTLYDSIGFTEVYKGHMWRKVF